MSQGAFVFRVPRSGGRVDRLVADATGRGRRLVGQWLREGRVLVGGQIAMAGDTPAAGERVEVRLPDEAPPAASTPVLRILLQQRHRLFLFKPAGLHSERGRSGGSAVEELQRTFGAGAASGARPEEGPLVHRLDRDTSGILVATLDAADHLHLRAAFRRGAVHKEYLALVAGRLVRPCTIDRALARRGARVVVAGAYDQARMARTEVHPLDSGPGWTLVAAAMSSGMTHQIRVHLASAGHPLVGDTAYGGPPLSSEWRRGQLLHAFRIALDGEFDVSAPAPADFVATYAALRRGQKLAA